MHTLKEILVIVCKFNELSASDIHCNTMCEILLLLELMGVLAKKHNRIINQETEPEFAQK